MQNLDRLRHLISVLPQRLRALPANETGHRSSLESWSQKEELGHLLDSAANNHQRMVRAQLEDQPAMPGSAGPQWVVLHGYQDCDWNELIDRWTVLNRQLLAAAEAATDAAASRTLTNAGAAPVTLQFVFDDYIEHMLEHLRHMGLAVEEFAAAPAR